MTVKYPANPQQIAAYGHIAKAIQKFLADKGWKPSQLNEAMGKNGSDATVYNLINSKIAPGDKLRPRLSKVTGIPESELMKRGPANPPVAHGPPPSKAIVVAKRKLDPDCAPMLSFTITKNGLARIMLDVNLPLQQATPLLRLLLDAGLILSPKESIDGN